MISSSKRPSPPLRPCPCRRSVNISPLCQHKRESGRCRLPSSSLSCGTSPARTHDNMHLPLFKNLCYQNFAEHFTFHILYLLVRQPMYTHPYGNFMHLEPILMQSFVTAGQFSTFLTLDTW